MIFCASCPRALDVGAHERRRVMPDTDAGDELGIDEPTTLCPDCFGELASAVATGEWRYEHGLEERPGSRPNFLMGGRSR